MSFLPNTDSGLRDWSIAFNEQVQDDPAACGLTPAQAAEYLAAHTSYMDTYAIAKNPATRTKPAVVAKVDSARNLRRTAGSFGRMIEANLAISNQKKSDLGLTVRDSEPSPIPPPSSKPIIMLGEADGFYLPFKIKNPGYSGRGKGPGISGVAIFTFVGPNPPQELHQWQFQANMSTMSGVIGFPPTLPPFSKVWVSGFFFNPRKQSGPMADPVSTNLGTFVVQEAA